MSTTVVGAEFTSEPLVETPRSGLSIDTKIDAQPSTPSPTIIEQRLQKLKVDTKRAERQDSRLSRMSTMLWSSPTERGPSGGDDAPKSARKDRSHHYAPGTCGYAGIYSGPNVSYSADGQVDVNPSRSTMEI